MGENLNDLWKHFFRTPKSIYNQYILKLLEFPDYIIYDKEIMREKRNNWEKHFLNNNPLYLEIGTGSGKFISELASKNKNINYIGIELRFKRICSCAKKAKMCRLKNVVFLRIRAENLLDLVPENSLSGLYINFPDPWEGDEKNRILQLKFFETLDIVMKKDAVLYFKTDHDKYYEDVLKLSSDLKNFKVIYNTNDLHNTEKNVDNIKTEFENLFLNKHNKNINYIEIQKYN